jgi:hypothetical protein
MDAYFNYPNPHVEIHRDPALWSARIVNGHSMRPSAHYGASNPIFLGTAKAICYKTPQMPGVIELPAQQANRWKELRRNRDASNAARLAHGNLDGKARSNRLPALYSDEIHEPA